MILKTVSYNLSRMFLEVSMFMVTVIRMLVMAADINMGSGD